MAEVKLTLTVDGVTWLLSKGDTKSGEVQLAVSGGVPADMLAGYLRETADHVEEDEETPGGNPDA